MSRPPEDAGQQAPPPSAWMAELAFQMGGQAHPPEAWLPTEASPEAAAGSPPPSILPPEVLAALQGQSPAPAWIVEAKALPAPKEAKAKGLRRLGGERPSLAEAQGPIPPKPSLAEQGKKLLGALPLGQAPAAPAGEPKPAGPLGASAAPGQAGAPAAGGPAPGPSSPLAFWQGKAQGQGLHPLSAEGAPAAAAWSTPSLGASQPGATPTGPGAAGPAGPTLGLVSAGAPGPKTGAPGQGGVPGPYGPAQGPTVGPPGSAFTWVFDPGVGWRLRPKGRAASGLRAAEAELGPSMPILDPTAGPQWQAPLPPGEVDPTRVEVGPVDDLAWAKELMATMAGMEDGRLGAIAPEALAGPQLDELRALLKGLPPAPAGFSLDQVPKQFMAFDAAMRHRLEGPTRRLAAEVVALPVVEAAFAVWDPKRPEQNQRVLNEVYGRVVGLMGGLLRFEPAPLAWPQQMKRGSYGYYSFGEHAVVLSEALLRLPMQEALATLIHEQAHALQGEWIARLGLPNRPARLRESRPLSHEERALALYWLWEFPRLDAFHSGKSKPKDPQAAHRMYRAFAVEHHAFFTEKLVVEACNGAFRSGAAWEGRLAHEPVAIASALLKGRG